MWAASFSAQVVLDYSRKAADEPVSKSPAAFPQGLCFKLYCLGSGLDFFSDEPCSGIISHIRFPVLRCCYSSERFITATERKPEHGGRMSLPCVV